VPAAALVRRDPLVRRISLARATRSAARVVHGPHPLANRAVRIRPQWRPAARK